MPCSNPEHQHWWVGTFTPLEPAPATKSKSKPPIPKINGRLVITIEPCERMCGFCPVNKRRKFRTAEQVVRHVNQKHSEHKRDGTVLRVRPSEDHARRPEAKGVSMRDSDKKYEWKDGSWERRDQEDDEEDEDELDPLSTNRKMKTMTPNMKSETLGSESPVLKMSWMNTPWTKTLAMKILIMKKNWRTIWSMAISINGAKRH